MKLLSLRKPELKAFYQGSDSAFHGPLNGEAFKVEVPCKIFGDIHGQLRDLLLLPQPQIVGGSVA